MTDALPAHKQWPSAWCNDTLNGKLEAWVRPEDREGDDPPYGKLGYWRMVEHRMIRAEFRAEHGRDPTSWELSSAVMRNHAGDATFAEISRALSARWRAESRGPAAFTTEQLQRLVDLFAGANDPVTRSIAEVAVLMLSERGELGPGPGADGESPNTGRTKAS